MNDDLFDELQRYQAEGQHLQIVQRLLEYEWNDLPDLGANVSIARDAICHTFQTSTSEEELRQADLLMIRLENKGSLDRSDMDVIFDAIGETLVKTKGETPFYLELALASASEPGVMGKWLDLYARAQSQEVKAALARQIGSTYRDRSLLVLVDCLYAQQLITGDRIRTLLEQHPLPAEADLAPEECEMIASAVLEYLVIPGPRIDTWEDEIRYKLDHVNRSSAARILVALNKYPGTSEETRARIHSHGGLTVGYYCVDRMLNDAFLEIPLSRYLSGHIL